MKLHHAPILALCLTASCDKAKDLAEQATSTVKERITEAAAQGGDAQTDPELQKLVDLTDEGVVFRKDLPFPARIEVITSASSHQNFRILEASAIERKSTTLIGVMESIDKFERSGDHVRHTQGKSRFIDPTVKDSDGKPKVITDNPLKNLMAAEITREFHRRDGEWRADQAGGFAAAAVAREIAPFFDLLLQEHGLAPRPQWFAKRRVKTGEQLVLTGDALAMLVSGEATGTLNLKLESLGAVAGHPCGVFSVTGDYSRQQFPSFAGGFTDEDVTIQSGKVWLSLIHPLVLKWEIDTIQTFKTGDTGGPRIQGQGSAKITISREWKAMEQRL
jgi:hypothetical protein